MLADKLGVTRDHLSQVLNRYAKKRFSDYINSYRIEEVIKVLNSPSLDGKKIIEITFESGFNSKSTFNNAFKKATGMHPIEFKISHKI